MVYYDAEWGWGHRDTILDRWANKVNIGIAFDETTLTYVQDFERDYIAWSEPVQLENGILTLKGEMQLGCLYAVVLFYTLGPSP